MKLRIKVWRRPQPAADTARDVELRKVGIGLDAPLSSFGAMVGEHPTQTTLPGEDLKPAWRAACVAYRKVRQVGLLDQPAWIAARAAVLKVRPDLGERAAGREASAAVHYASVYHTKWLWKGAGDPRYWETN